MKNQRKVKNLLINTKFQFKFFRWLLLLMVSTYITLLCVGKWIIVDFLDHIIAAPNIPQDVFVLASKVKEGMPLIAILLLALMLCFFSVASLLISHKIAGPIYNFEKNIDEMMKTGKRHHIRLRKNDLFKGLEQKFNGLMDSVDKD